MAKAILEFDLDNFDDRKEHKKAILANEMASALFELKTNFISKINDAMDMEELTTEDLYNKMMMYLEDITGDFNLDDLD